VFLCAGAYPPVSQEDPWITAEGTCDSSGKLQTRIEQGLEADVFMSAAIRQMNALADQNLVSGDSMEFFCGLISVPGTGAVPASIIGGGSVVVYMGFLSFILTKHQS
jgi:hypothetical protein